MVSKKTVQFLRSLSQKKQRIEHGCFLIEGEKMIREALKSSVNVTNIYISSELENRWDFNQEIELINAAGMRSISQLKTAPGCLAICEIPEITPVSENAQLTLVLDGIKDPGNLGTILRTAEAFGVQQILASKETVDAYNSKVVQSSMGSIFRMPIVYGELSSLIQGLSPSTKIHAAFLEGESHASIAYEFPLALVLGSESHGIQSFKRGSELRSVRIEHHPNVESLNVAMATGILLSEVRRQLPL